MIWKTKDHEFDLTSRALVMGVLNVTADSFSDGGRFLAPDDAVRHALAMVAGGADIIDVGGESTRPGAEPVSAEIEMARVIPVIERLSAQTDRAISIDTSKASVAAAAIKAGASIINDVTAMRADGAMAIVAERTGAGVILMHMQGTPRDMQANPHYGDVVAEVGDFFRQSFERALRCGINPMRIAFDPGIGFGKTVEHNLLLLKNLAALRIENRPLVLGVSRKSFIGKILEAPSHADRLWPTVALTSYAREQDANILRVHDVRPNAEALRMTEAILSAT
jgi:dihydropteroate synthase